MDYSNIFSYMQAEVTLIAVIVLLFLYDLIAGERGRRWFSAVACGLLAVHDLKLINGRIKTAKTVTQQKSSPRASSSWTNESDS